jgi:sugar lactone lactonase YvrE
MVDGAAMDGTGLNWSLTANGSGEDAHAPDKLKARLFNPTAKTMNAVQTPVGTRPC